VCERGESVSPGGLGDTQDIVPGLIGRIAVFGRKTLVWVVVVQ